MPEPTNPPDCRFEELSHTAEVGLRVWAHTPAALFACAGQSMFNLIGAESEPASNVTQRMVKIEAPDSESLLVDWLSELVYLYETTGEVYLECQVDEWTSTSLTATVHGCLPNQAPALHVKAVTYYDLQVRQIGDEWMAQVYFDI